MNTFNESQRFRQPWVWIIMSFVILILLGSLTAVDAWAKPASWLSVIPMILIVLVLYVWRLDTRLDSAGIHYRVFPFLPWRTISWNAVKSATVRQYEFVGYGIRWGFDGWVYNVAGHKGLRIVFPDRRQITIGTQLPDELQQFLNRQHVLQN